MGKRRKAVKRPRPNDWEKLKKHAWAGAKSLAMQGAMALLANRGYK